MLYGNKYISAFRNRDESPYSFSLQSKPALLSEVHAQLDLGHHQLRAFTPAPAMIRMSVTASLHLGGKSHHRPCPRHAFAVSGGVPGGTQPSPRTRPRQDGGAKRADGENNGPGQQSDGSRKRGAHEAYLARLTLGWHQRLSEAPAKQAPAMPVWFLSSPGAPQPSSERQAQAGRMSPPPRVGVAPFPLPSPLVPGLGLI